MLDSRELSFDDLSAPLAEATPLGGDGPFVINLGASSAPLELPTEDLTGGSQAYVYRIRRNEDGRVRYRLRLGPFVREEDADAVLARVRNVYPSALTATAWVEDLNAIAVQQAKAGISRPVTESMPRLRSVPEISTALQVSTPPQVSTVPQASSVAHEIAPVDATVTTELKPAVEQMHAAEEVVCAEPEPAGEEIILAEAAPDGDTSDPTDVTDPDDGDPTLEAVALTELALASEAVEAIAATRSMPGPSLEFPELLLMDEASLAKEQGRPVDGTVASPAATGRVPVLEASFDALSASLSLEAPLPEEAPAIAATPSPARTPAPKSVTPPAVAKPAAVQAATIRPVPTPAVTRAATSGPLPAARAVAPTAPRRADPAREAPLSLETTQTLRPLTPKEMQDETALRWFVVQLSSSDQAFDPSTVPNLDIFLLYRLYSVTSVDQGRQVHALRLGFFGEEMAAHAVSSYLKSYYENPLVKRVSVAERERFSEHRLDARKDVGETGQHAAIELSTERPTAKVEIPPPTPAPLRTVQPTAAVRAAALRQIAGQVPKKEKPAGVFASLPWIGRRK